MGCPVSEPVRLRVSFDAPETTTIELQGPALQAYRDWQAGLIDEEVFEEVVMEQCEDHVAQWTLLRDWNEA